MVASGEEYGGTWSGAAENLRAGWVALHVLKSPDAGSGNSVLVAMGAVELGRDGASVSALLPALSIGKAESSQQVTAPRKRDDCETIDVGGQSDAHMTPGWYRWALRTGARLSHPPLRLPLAAAALAGHCGGSSRARSTKRAQCWCPAQSRDAGFLVGRCAGNASTAAGGSPQWDPVSGFASAEKLVG